MANVYLWGESDKAKNGICYSCKGGYQLHKEKTGMLIETQKSGGGSTNTVVMAKTFLSPEHREEICSLIKNETNREFF